MIFYVGLDDVYNAKHFDRCCISVNRVRNRKKPLEASEVLLDSGAFTELYAHGHYRHGVEAYAAEIRRLAELMPIKAAVAQDYMCEPFILERTGKTVAEHQRLTLKRFDALSEYSLPAPIMPVLQGFDPADYTRHLRAYGLRLKHGAWVGVGSVCKRNGSPVDIVNVLSAIRGLRPDLRLHGFGVKRTALADPSVRSLLYSADSMAWSYAARRQGRNAHDWREAKAFERQVLEMAGRSSCGWQGCFDFAEAAE